MSHPLTAAVLSATLCVAALPAQGRHTISPVGHNLSYGTGATGYPWGYPAASFPQFRYQQIHDDLAGPPRVLLGLAIRRKESGAAYAGFSSTLQFDMSSAAVGSQASTSTYATNHGANKQTVMMSRVVNFPAVNPPTNSLPAPLTYVVLFDQPYLHNGLAGICWEVLMTANTNAASLTFDLAYNAVTRNQAYGTGCGGTALTGSYAAPNLSQTATGLAPNSVGLFLIATNNETFAGLPLPFDLAGIGAPGCSLFVDPIVTLVVPADAAGTATLQTNVTGFPNFSVCVQVATPSSATPVGLAFSNGLHASPLVPATFMRNWNSAVASTTGTLQITFALVTDFIQP